MAEAKQKSGLAIGACLALLFQVSSAATSHTVGDSTGWTIPSTSSLYTTWASKQTFQVGDFLVFNFQSGAHTVAEVTKSAYDSCGTANPITQVNNSPANLTITSSGTHYYICTFSGHCLAGQKLSITATSAPAAKSTPSPAESPAPKSAPSPKSSPATAPTPSTAAPTHAPSSASPTPAPTPTAAPSSASPTPASTPTAAPTPGPSASPTAAPETAPTPAPGVVAPTTSSSPAASGPLASGPRPPSPPSPTEEPTRSTPNSPSSASSAVAALMLPLLVIIGANFLY